MRLIFYSIMGLFFYFLGAAWSMEEARDFKTQKKSLIRWSELNSEDWLSYRLWKNDLARREKEPEWETRVRERNSKEIVGRVLECVGVCRVYRGEAFFSADYRSALREGDELFTIGESYIWIFMLDGTMVRLAPESSITFNEFNIGAKENFIHARLNAGNILWLSRQELALKESNLRETDSLFLPLSFYEANPSKQVLQKASENDLFALLEDPKHELKQIRRLNKLIEKNNKVVNGKPTYSFLIMPNGNINGYNLNMEFVIQVGDVSYIKRRSLDFLNYQKGEELPEGQATFYFRGLENTDEINLIVDQWYEVGRKGRKLEKFSNRQKFNIGEYITRHISSILVGRELMLRKYSFFLFDEDLDPDELASYGYRLWGRIESEEKEDLALRIDFLREYTRRTETTNLLSSERFRRKIKNLGGSVEQFTYGPHFYQKALNHLIKVRELNRQDYVDSDREELNSTKKRFWKIIHDIR